MDPVRSSLAGGVVASLVFGGYLLLADLVIGGPSLYVFTTFTGLCDVGGPPYCTLGSPTALGLTLLVFAVLFVVAWPLFFAGFTWGLPGESGLAHGAVFGAILWTGYAVVLLIGFGAGDVTFLEEVEIVALSLAGYVLYGLVLGGGYDALAHHRTLLSPTGST